MAVLATAASVGATSLQTSVMCPAPFVIVGKNLPTAELCEVQSLVGNTLTLKQPLAHDHSPKEVLHPFDGGIVPAPWFGLRMTNAEVDAPVNTALLNYLSQRIYQIGVVKGLTGIRIDGHFFVDDVIRLERDQTLEGGSPTGTCIRAATSFPFDDTGEKAVIVGYRDGLKVQYAVVGATARWYLRNFQINCQRQPNSNGILASLNQPQTWDSIRVDGSRGLYGICLADTADAKLNAIMLVDNNCGLRLRGASIVKISGLNVEQTKGPSSVLLENLGAFGCKWVWIDSVHMEPGLETAAFNVTGAAHSFHCHGLYYANPQTGTAFRFDTPLANPGGKCRYVLSNLYCDSNSQTFKIVDDIQRGKSLTSWNTDTDRWIDLITPRILMAGYTKTP